MTEGAQTRHATLDWSAAAPRSIFFDDIYFSGDGPAETAHVFLGGNDLPARFETAARFAIGELGFGSGLNFLAAWDAFRKARKPDGARLDFFSVEAFPMAPADLEKAHASWPPFAALSAQLRAAYPPLHHGFHRLTFADRVTLTLYFGDALDGLERAEGAIKAWFLDGFSPDKNPEMWRPEIMSEAARLSAANASFATFTVAGAVKRAMNAAGFEIEKRPGYGRKREMLAGRLNPHAPRRTHRRPWYDTRPNTPLKPGASIAIAGAGIAGAALASELTRAGYDVSIFDPNSPASGASGNPAGLIMPRLDADDTPAARFFVQGYLHTIHLLNELQTEHARIFNPCGALLHAGNDKERARQAKLVARPALPAGWLEQRGDGLFFPQAGIVDPPAFVDALLGDARLIKEKITRLHQIDGAWRVETPENTSRMFDAVIIAAGLETLRFAQSRSLPLTGAAGQIDWFRDAGAPSHAHAFGAYAAPAPQGGLIIGATYAPAVIGAEARFTREATRSTIDAVMRTLPQLAAALDPGASTPRASIRCTTPDQLPIAGPVPDWGFYSGAYDGLRQGRQQDYAGGQSLTGLFTLTGLGSRGLVTAPLLAAMIASDITGAPAPVDWAVAEALHPARFFIRDLKRASVV